MRHALMQFVCNSMAIQVGLINQEFLDTEKIRLGPSIQYIMNVISIIQLVPDTNQNISSMQIMERICR